MTFHDEASRNRPDPEHESLTRALKLSSACSMVLVRTKTEEDFLDAIYRLAAETGGYRMAWVGFAEQDAACSVSYRAHAGHHAGCLDSVTISWSDDMYGQGPVGTAIKIGKTVVINDYASSPAMGPWQAQAAQRGCPPTTGVAFLLFWNHGGIFFGGRHSQ
ncbi:MAG: GAF domain-containing protein [Herminiimonas sp.]|nr:GAF domain-containing protein [Herminiimonas sp.]